MVTLKNRIRKFLFSKMSQNAIDRFYMLYYKVRYPNEMEKRCSYGSANPDKIFYIIRPHTGKTEGLMSLFINVAKNLYFAYENNYEPVVDFMNYHTQYDDNVNGEKNSWNYYFTQPSKYSLEDVYKSKNVILSGLEIQWYTPELFQRNFENENLRKLNEFIFNRIGFSKTVLVTAEDEIRKLDINFNQTLGLYLRGTDYVALKPSGHPVQPTTGQAINIVNNYIKKYTITKIFLVTEDDRIYRTMRETYGDMCKIVSYDSFITNYKGKNYLSHDVCINDLNPSSYKRGLEYLVKLIILSKCAYFIGGNTMGSWAACVFSKYNFKEKYIFNLGVYGK